MPRGNPNGNPGNKGGGRASAFVEREEGIWLKNVWKTDTDTDVLKAKIAKGKYSIRDIFLAKVLSGNERLIAVAANKIMPDLTELSGPDGEPLKVDLIGEARKRSAKYHRDAKGKPKTTSAKGPDLR